MHSFFHNFILLHINRTKGFQNISVSFEYHISTINKKFDYCGYKYLNFKKNKFYTLLTLKTVNFKKVI